MKDYQRHYRHSLKRLTGVTASALIVAALFASVTALMQSRTIKPPYPQAQLLQMVKLNSLSVQETVNYIQSRGVAFELTPDAESQFRQAGATDEILAAIRANYRPAAVVAGNNSSGNAPNIPSGPPLSKDAITSLLQNGVSPARVEQNVQARGVSFVMTPEVAREIIAAGGTNALVGAISAKALTESNSANTTAANKAPDYDTLVDRAVTAYNSDRHDDAIQFLNEAVKLDPSQPFAYTQLGFMQLYGKNDISAAEAAMKAAIEHGGVASFRVRHDHGVGDFQQFCQGSFFVGKDGVTFRANDGKHTFEAKKAVIKEIKLNKAIGNLFAIMGNNDDPHAVERVEGAFHVKVNRDGSTKNYNFAPATAQKAESRLLTSLAQSY